MSIYGINLDLFSSSPIVILKVEDENRYLPIWIGQPEARSILMKLQNQEFSRPLTHDLAVNLVSELGGSMEKVTVTELDRKSTRLNSSHANISYAVFCLKKKKNMIRHTPTGT